jgi:hypothetical protein
MNVFKILPESKLYDHHSVKPTLSFDEIVYHLSTTTIIGEYQMQRELCIMVL